MPVITYSINAASCPAIQVSTSSLDPTSSTPTPTTASTLTAGASGPGSLTLPFGRNAVRLDLLGKHGGGAVAVAEGLDITYTSGLTITVTAGVAMSDGPVKLVNAATVGLTDNSTRYVWFLQGGTPTTTNTTTAPSSTAVFLGKVVTAGGVVTVIDYSGRWELRGGLLWRRTGDAGTPGDTPPSTARFYNRTNGGIYIWDGSSYWGGTIDAKNVMVSSGDTNPAYLETKLVGDGSSITITKLNAGANESLQFSVTAGGITTAKLANNSVTFSKLQSDAATDLNRAVGTDHLRDLCVTQPKIANGAVGSTQIASGAVGSTQIAAGAVGTTQLANLGVTTGKLALNAADSTIVASHSSSDSSRAIGSDHIKSNAVIQSKIATGAVGSSQIANNAVGTTQLALLAVDSTILAANAVTTAKINTNAVDSTKLSTALQDLLPQVTFSVGTESGNIIAVTCTFKDTEGNALSFQSGAYFWLSDSAGGVVTSTAPSVGTSAFIGTIVKTFTANIDGMCVSNASGVISLWINHVGAQTWYLNMILGGRLYTSAAITFV